ncbi:toprim domain-containing protein [Stutzerimonas kunmingensis]|uniref:toprim domain-containing protein n=1 Tax=Stutzerimonas kunmingensis TaxID=1211807 RepID=UPI0028A9DE0D|nr:toprim domain-containing protein [Stutzerimonas kunmingensis]
MTIQNGACAPKGSLGLDSLIEPVALHLLGKPNTAMSKGNELRFGTRGSLAVDLEKGTWFSHEEGIGGGTLDLIAKQTGIASRSEQLAWLEKQGLKEQKPTRSPASPKVLAKPQIDTTYAYKDERGRLLFEVVRFEPKDFRQRKPDGRGGWIWSVKDVKQVPYHLPQLIESNPSQLVFVVEGEKDVLRLESLGLTATCNAGGAGKWPDELSKHFAHRRVVILPDNDEAGHRHADKVAHALGMADADVRVLCLPGLPPKGDVSDWLDAGGTVAQLLELVTAPGNHLPEDEAPTEQNFEPADEDDEKQSQASLLVKFVEQRFELFHDPNKDVFVRERSTGEVRSLASRQFRDCLVAGFYMDTGKAPRDQSIREALTTLAGLGRFHGELRDVHLRMAGDNGEYWLDLAAPGSSRAVRLRAGHWEIIEAVEVAFVRPESMQPLPDPIPGGSIDALWKVANVPHGARLLALTWLIECLRPETPFPVMELLGEQGSAKSTTQTALRRLIDPNACDLRGAPKTVEDVFVSAGACAMVSYENISHLPAPMQDALCVLATGGGFAKRKLYSDAEESVITVKRPIILNGISAAVTAQDLVDRAITIETPVITERQEVTGLWREYEESRAHLLGALLDIAAKALAALPDMQIPAYERPRLVEFALLGMAVAKAAGHSPDDFLREFNACRQESLARTIDASPVAAAVVDMIEARPQGITAPAKEILLILEQYRPTGCDSWPRSAKGLGDALRRAAPALRQIDIDCKCLGKIGGAVKWEVKRKKPKQSPACPEVLQNAQKIGNQQDIRTCRTSSRDLSPAEVAFDEADAEVF